MGNTISRGTLDVISILFPFVLSAGLIITIVICWWKCKLFVDKRRPGGKERRMEYPEEPDFGHLINIQEYAENQVGTTIVYADAVGSACPHPYVYFSDGRITRIVPLIPSPTYSSQNHDHAHSSCPSALLCNNLPRTRNNNMGGSDHHCNHHNNRHNNSHGPMLLHPNHSVTEQNSSNIHQIAEEPAQEVQCTVTTSTTSITSLTPESNNRENLTELSTDTTQLNNNLVNYETDLERNTSSDNINSGNLHNGGAVGEDDRSVSTSTASKISVS